MGAGTDDKVVGDVIVEQFFVQRFVDLIEKVVVTAVDNECSLAVGA